MLRDFRAVAPKGVALLFAVAPLACQLVDPNDRGELLTLTIANPSLTANNVATTAVRATFRADTDARIEVKFESSAGRFLAAKQDLKSVVIETTGAGRTAENFAEAVLQAGDQEALVVVTASTEHVTVADTLRFVSGVPDDLFLGANRTVAVANGNETISLTANLTMLDPLAKATQGTVVFFEATDSGGAAEPLLSRRGVSQPDGTARVSLTSTVAGSYTIIASVEGGPADTLLVEFRAP